MKQKIIITNNNLLFKFSDHNNLPVLKLWKSTRSVIIFNKNYGKVRAGSLFSIRSRGSAIKLYFFSSCIFLSNNFDVSFFGLSDNSGLVCTPRQLHVVFSYELNLFRPENEKY